MKQKITTVKHCTNTIKTNTMKQITFLLVFIIFNLVSYGQGIDRVELTNDEIKYLKKSIVTLNMVTDKQMEEATKNNLVNFDFEILYDNNTIYRGVINKPFFGGFGDGIYRTEFGFCIPYKELDTDTILELIENRKGYKVESESGKKFICNGGYRLFDLTTKKFNNKLSEKLQIKLYKLIYN